MEQAKQIKSKWDDIGIRVTTGVILVPVVLLAIIIGFPFFEIMLLAVAGITTLEIVHVIKTAHKHRHLPATVYWLLGILYVNLPLVFMYGIYYTHVQDIEGLWWIIILFICNWVTDSMALVGGRLWGKRKLAPRISPNKTLEGTVVGLTSGISAGTIFAIVIGVQFPLALAVSIMISVLTTMGDLLESKIKRIAGVKDTSKLLPGHGGFMDRLDGIYLAAPSLFILLSLL
jgi:phosphatidate cytidylyltransferase